MPPRRASNLARMAADMTVARALSLVALKAVDFTSLSANGDFFFVSYFSRLFGQGSSDVLVNLFLGIAQKLEYEALRDGLAWFFKKRFAAHIESLSDEKEASLFRERLALARRYMK